MKKSKMMRACFALLGAAMMATTVSAHGVFFADRTDMPTLVLGEGPVDNAYSPSMVTKIDAYDVMYNPMMIKEIPQEKNVAIEAPKELGTTVTFFDYGFFTKDKDGVMHAHQSIQDVPNAVKSTHAIKYNVNYWNPDVMPVQIANVPIQIVPSVNPLKLRKGDTYEIQVFKDGKPYANAPLIKDVINDLTNESTADENGKAMVTVSANGLNVVGVEVAMPTDDSRIQNKYFSSLSFTIQPE